MKKKRERRNGNILSDFSRVKLILRSVYFAETRTVSHNKYAIKPLSCIQKVHKGYTETE